MCVCGGVQLSASLVFYRDGKALLVGILRTRVCAFPPNGKWQMANGKCPPWPGIWHRMYHRHFYRHCPDKQPPDIPGPHRDSRRLVMTGEGLHPLFKCLVVVPLRSSLLPFLWSLSPLLVQAFDIFFLYLYISCSGCSRASRQHRLASQ